MIDIDEYIMLSNEERKVHLDLTETCIFRGGNSTQFRGLLAYFLNTTIPKGNRVVCCHACNNGACSNPRHMYWGTTCENNWDRFQVEINENGKILTIWDRTVRKYGIDEAKQLAKKAGQYGKLGGREKGCKLSDDHKRKISEALKGNKNAGRVVQ